MNKNNIIQREAYTSPFVENMGLTNVQSLLVSLSIRGDIEDFEEGEEL
ncbi:MAG: hypothetical protein Q4A61_06935 [Porphyromonadaceae bacterium]|nr:hypothetical protein [Porphyromonadaceae bacterium]